MNALASTLERGLDLRVRARLESACLPLLVAALVCSIPLACGIGALEISPRQVLAILASRLGWTSSVEFAPEQEAVLLALRIPRVLTAALVGGALACAGAALQGLFRNPLADPALIGVSSGAALGGVLALWWAPTFLAATFATSAVPVCACLGGLAATACAWKLAGRRGATAGPTLLLAGIALNALAFATIGLLSSFADDARLRAISLWNLGSLGGASWTVVAWLTALVVPALVVLCALRSALDALLLGERTARHLGVDVRTCERRIVIASACAVGGGVAFSGLIGFVGLVVPNALRLAIGPRHTRLLPASALLGALLLLWADVAARTLLAPAELPVGGVTALLGAPFFLVLLLRRRARGEA